MKVAVIPDAAMIIIPLIEKNGHEYISPTNFSKYNNMDVCDGEIDTTFNLNRNNIFTASPYFSNELPAGIKGRLTLFSRVLDEAEAFIILGKRPNSYKRMYDTLNDLILFGGTGCINEHKIAISLIKQKQCPILELAYPTTKEEIINLINRTNDFLRNIKGFVNDDNLNVDLEKPTKTLNYDIFKKILDDLIYYK